MTEPKWLSSADVVAINQEQLALTPGEVHFLRDVAAIENAVATPRNHWLYQGGNLTTLSCVLIRSVGRAHAFEQGNKRTAFFAGATFLEVNGAYFDVPDTEVYARIVEDLIMGRLSLESMVDLLALAIVLPPDF